MRPLPPTPIRRLLATLAVLLVLTQGALAVEQPAEASRVRFLIVVDTHDSDGATWGLDGRNLKAVLEAGLRKQQLDGRFTIETLVGNGVRPDNVLKHYADLKLDADEALVFYYSGHGAYHASRGHFLAFTHGNLFRKDLLAAMQKHNPRLTVLLTDCCADFAGGSGTRPAPQRTTPPTGSDDGVADIPDTPPRPGKKGPGDDNKPKTKQALETSPVTRPFGGKLSAVVLRTGDGALPLKTILEKTDGEVMRHLFFRHTGLVDVNGCKKGKSSHGTIPWGGSLFTIGFMSLQKEPVSKFDKNGDGLVEWDEFFPHLQTSCSRAGKSVGAHQVPDAVQLAQPVTVKK
jgi:hypothetical protein